MKVKFRHDPLHINSLSLIDRVGYRKESRHQNVHKVLKTFSTTVHHWTLLTSRILISLSASKGEKDYGSIKSIFMDDLEPM